MAAPLNRLPRSAEHLEHA